MGVPREPHPRARPVGRHRLPGWDCDDDALSGQLFLCVVLSLRYVSARFVPATFERVRLLVCCALPLQSVGVCLFRCCQRAWSTCAASRVVLNASSQLQTATLTRCPGFYRRYERCQRHKHRLRRRWRWRRRQCCLTNAIIGSIGVPPAAQARRLPHPPGRLPRPPQRSGAHRLLLPGSRGDSSAADERDGG